MKINLIIIWLVLSVIFVPLPTCAKSTTETEVNTLFKTVTTIIYERTDISNYPKVDEKKADEAINCIIEIYKKKPDSIEAYYCASYLLKYIPTKAMKAKFDTMKERHLPNLSDPNFEIAEKLIFLYLMAAPSKWVDHSDINGKKYDQAINDFMYNIIDNCKDKNYSVLAAAELSIVPLISLECKKKMVEIAPNHPAIPYIMGGIVSREYQSDPPKRIKELQSLIDKYGSRETPNGWNMAIEYYYLIGFAYVDMKDHENAKIYYDKINKEVPNYWNLKGLKMFMDQLIK